MLNVRHSIKQHSRFIDVIQIIKSIVIPYAAMMRDDYQGGPVCRACSTHLHFDPCTSEQFKKCSCQSQTPLIFEFT